MATYSSIKYSNTPTNSVTTADIADTTISVPKLSSTLDISGKTVTLPNTSVTNAMLAGSIDLTSKVTGALPIANGGLGLSSVTASQAVKVNSGATALEFGAVGGGLLQMKAFRKTSGYVQSSSTSEHTNRSKPNKLIGQTAIEFNETIVLEVLNFKQTLLNRKKK